MQVCFCHFRDDPFTGCAGHYQHHVVIDDDGSLSWENGKPANLQGNVTVVFPLLSDAFHAASAERMQKGFSAFTSLLGGDTVTFVVLAGLISESGEVCGQVLGEIADQFQDVNLVLMCDQYVDGVPLRTKTAGNRDDLYFGIQIVCQVLGSDHGLLEEFVSPQEYRSQHGKAPAACSIGLRFLRHGVRPIGIAARCELLAAGITDVLGLHPQGQGERPLQQPEISNVLSDMDQSVAAAIPNIQTPVLDLSPQWCIQSEAVARGEFQSELDRCVADLAGIRQALNPEHPLKVGGLFSGSVATQKIETHLLAVLSVPGSSVLTIDTFLSAVHKQAEQANSILTDEWSRYQDGGSKNALPQLPNFTAQESAFRDVMRSRPSLALFYGWMLGSLACGMLAGWFFWNSRRLIFSVGLSELQWIGVGIGFGVLLHIVLWSFLMSPWAWLRERIFPSRRKRFRAFLRKLSMPVLAGIGGYVAWRLTGQVSQMLLYQRMVMSVGITLVIAAIGSILGFSTVAKRWLVWKRESFDPVQASIASETDQAINAFAAEASHFQSRMRIYVHARALQSLQSVIRGSQQRLEYLCDHLKGLREQAYALRDQQWDILESPRNASQLCEYAIDGDKIARCKKKISQLVKRTTGDRQTWGRARDVVTRVTKPGPLTSVNSVIDDIGRCVDTAFDVGDFNLGAPEIPSDGLPVREVYGVNTVFRRGTEAFGVPLCFHLVNQKLAHGVRPTSTPANWGAPYETDGDFLMGWALRDRWLPLSTWIEEMQIIQDEFENRTT